MALKRLGGPSRRLLRQCSSTPTQRAFFSCAAANPILPLQYASSKPSPVRTFKFPATRAFTSSAIRLATSQEPPNTKSYLASGAFASGETQLVDVKRVLVIGSGGLSIGQAGEFDYSGEHPSPQSAQSFIKTANDALGPPADVFVLFFRIPSAESIERGGCHSSPHKSQHRNHSDRPQACRRSILFTRHSGIC